MPGGNGGRLVGFGNVGALVLNCGFRIEDVADAPPRMMGRQRRCECRRLKRETMTTEEAAISNMWEIAAIPETAFPEPYLLTETENTIIDDIFELRNKHGLTSHQSQNFLERLGRILLRWDTGWRGGRRTNQEALTGSTHVTWKPSS